MRIASFMTGLAACVSMPACLAQIQQTLKIDVSSVLQPNNVIKGSIKTSIDNTILADLTLAGIGGAFADNRLIAENPGNVAIGNDTVLEVHNALSADMQKATLTHTFHNLPLDVNTASPIQVDVKLGEEWSFSYTLRRAMQGNLNDFVMTHAGGVHLAVPHPPQENAANTFSTITANPNPNIHLQPVVLGSGLGMLGAWADQHDPVHFDAVEVSLSALGPNSLRVVVTLAHVPEPESYAMAMGGLGVGWGVWRRWRRRVA